MLVMCLILYSNEFPLGKKILEEQNARILREFPVHMCKASIIYKGHETQITLAMEQILCGGRNFEHTHGSIHSSKLELLFQLYGTWKLVVENHVRLFAQQVCIINLLLLLAYCLLANS